MSRNLQANYAISFLFCLDFVLHACKILIRCDSFEILNFACKQGVNFSSFLSSGSARLWSVGVGVLAASDDDMEDGVRDGRRRDGGGAGGDLPYRPGAVPRPLQGKIGRASCRERVYRSV